ncbi:MAG: M28 family peptidase [Anaerolineae bacterium]
MPSLVPAPGLLSEVSTAELMRNTTAISQWIRLSAMPEEWAAADYVRDTLTAYGVETRVHEAEILVSLPRTAAVSVVSPTGATFKALTHSFATSTPPGGLTAELVYVGNGAPSDYEGRDVRGKIVLVDGLAGPTVAWAAEQAGAVGEVYITGDNLHFMIVTTIWGTPTPETAWRMPKTPSASIVGADGERLKALLAGGPVTVRLDTEVWTGWATAHMVEGRLDGVEEPDKFVLFSGHLDSWEYGAMDNGTANATMLEVMRVLAQRRGELRRGVRALFWSGHSHGRYAGSTWYVDHHWQELFDNCVAHVNIDSTGARGATAYDVIHSMSDLGGLAANVVMEITGQSPAIERMGRNSDQSFWGLGIPAMYGMLSRVPPEMTTPDQGALAALGIGGMPWWWHTVDDTVDKIDPAVLTLDTQVFLDTVYRLCTVDILPFNYAEMAREMAAVVAALAAAAGDRFDLAPVLAELDRLEASAERLNRAAGQASAADAAAINAVLMRLGRLLIPLNYTESGTYDQDLAVGTPPLPTLQSVRQLAGLAPDSDGSRYLKTRMLRARNQAVHTLRQANEAIASFFAEEH